MAKEIVQPRIRGFIATNAHPEGCRARVQAQIETTQALGVDDSGGNVLVLGASNGYGLASRIVAGFGYGAKTLGVFFEREASAKRTATAGYYNSVAYHEAAEAAGLGAWSLNGDAFSDKLKADTVALIREHMGPIDTLIYSLAAPRRTHPKTGITHQSTLKPTGDVFTGKSINLNTGAVDTVTIEPASGVEVADTIQVMGGEDFALWVSLLLDEGLLAEGAKAVAYSYIGPAVTHDIYRSGTIGMAKLHLEETTPNLSERIADAVGGSAYVSVNKAVITPASAAIPVVPLYMSMLYPVMREVGTHEAPIDQMNRLFREHLSGVPVTDDAGRIRLDDREMVEDVQQEIARRWDEVNTANLADYADFPGFQREFRQLFGFEVEGQDYGEPVEVERALPS
jgi:enoyl-[acyl-carrier protein] reductase / trans-2-enoyl-CoA reductase (NAD+)